MRKINLVFIVIAMLLLSACADKNSTEKKNEETPEEEKVGFSMTGDSIEAAQNVPEEEKAAILDAFDRYITTFNNQDLEGYMEIISDSYDVAEEKEFLEDHFEKYEQIREPSNVTIVKYNEDEAQVFANIDNQLKQLSTGFETGDTIRQVTVFTKENDEWKIKSVHSIGENPSE